MRSSLEILVIVIDFLKSILRSSFVTLYIYQSQIVWHFLTECLVHAYTILNVKNNVKMSII